jgi:FtsZ-binding cell division protein ZapB
MAIDFRATAQLNIETLTDKAQSDILALSELMNRKLNPETAGQFSPTQNAALEQGIAQRAADLTAATGSTVTPEQVKQTLQDISQLEKELTVLFEKREAASNRVTEAQKSSNAILEEQKNLKEKANDLLGIQADN